MMDGRITLHLNGLKARIVIALLRRRGREVIPNFIGVGIYSQLGRELNIFRPPSWGRWAKVRVNIWGSSDATWCYSLCSFEEYLLKSLMFYGNNFHKFYRVSREGVLSLKMGEGSMLKPHIRDWGLYPFYRPHPLFMYSHGMHGKQWSGDQNSCVLLMHFRKRSPF